MGKFKIEMTKDEMIRYYANKIVEDGIRDCTEFSNLINISNYGDNAMKYKDEILEQMYMDERLADVNLDQECNFDMVFYTDYCPYYVDEEGLEVFDSKIIEDFIYYSLNHLFEESYISTRKLINNFVADRNISDKDYRDSISNMLKKCIIDSGFTEKNIKNIEAFVTTKNYKEFENSLMSLIQDRQEELE